MTACAANLTATLVQKSVRELLQAIVPLSQTYFLRSRQFFFGKDFYGGRNDLGHVDRN